MGLGFFQLLMTAGHEWAQILRSAKIIAERRTNFFIIELLAREVGTIQVSILCDEDK